MSKPNNRGGKREGAGRKSKAEEEKVSSFALGAMKEVFGSEEKAWKALADKAGDSYNHMRLLFEYAYGKPKETIDANHTGLELIIRKKSNGDSNA